MDVPASPAELPALKEFLGSFQGRFRRPEGAEALERSRTGRLTARPNKHCDTMALAVPGTSEQRWQECLTNRPWEAEDLNRQRVQQMTAEAVRGHGVWVLDDPGFPQQGQTAVGGARQSSGTRGQIGNCQLAMTCGDTAPQATWPVAVRLSLPHAWAAEPERRGKARMPAAVPFQTTPEIAVARLAEARAWGVPQRCVVADADDGDNPHCLAGLEARQERYVVGVRPDFRVSGQRNATGPVQRAAVLLHALPRGQWRTSRGRQGTPGGRRQQCVAGRCWRSTSDGQRHVGWLLGERATRGQPEDRKSYWRHLPVAATLEELAGSAQRRYAVEPCPEEAPGERGWDQSQGRLWPGFHRHAVTVMLAYSLLVWLQRRERYAHRRRGRPRDPCSPSPGPTAADAASGPS
jgi:SRSO17 transposase